MNIKKLFSVAAVVTFLGSTFLPGLALAATPDTELGKAYEWAYANGITTKDTYEAANMTAPITRAEMAKMLSNYAKKFQEKTPDTSATCNFNDTASVGGDLAVAIVESCQLGIMGQGINAFRPYDTITRAEFGTALSRVLWDKTYEGGTPYYAGHLNALKAAGIMTVIANAETMKEVRGYVMLMLMRSENETPSICEETDVKVICAVEEAAEEYKDCPAACRKDNTKEEKDEDNTVVKSGDLAVSATAADGRKALIGGVSDLDTITFKTSEEVTISSITLERYGYSTIDDIQTVQLEDEDGNIIADAKEPNSKGQVKLTIKKDYKTVDGTYRATVVVKTRELGKDAAYYTADTDVNPGNADAYHAAKNGSTLGFKVVAADSTAKNLNLDDYSPYTYDLVSYAGSKVQFSSRNPKDKSYNWEAEKLYEVNKFRVKAPADATILVKGFTLTDNKGNKIDADKYAKDVTVTVNGKEVSGLKWNINKNDELVISFSEVEVAGKETATFAVNMSFTEEFDNLGAEKGVVQYYIKDISNFNATDKKTGTRVSEGDNNTVEGLSKTAANGWTTYTFNGGKIKISGSKLGTVNAAAGATNVKVAEGEITITEAIRGSAMIRVKDAESAARIDEIRLVINKVEYDGTKGAAVGGKIPYTFKGLEIEKSGSVEVRVDLKSDDANGNPIAGNIEFAGSLNSDSFKNGDTNLLKYDVSGEDVLPTQIAGSVNVSNIKVQAAKASLENKLTKEAEIIKGETNRKTIFEGTYEAKKGAVTLKNFTITAASNNANLAIAGTATTTFYVTINKEEYDADWSADTKSAKGDIDDIEVADGGSVAVKVEVEVSPAKTLADGNETFTIKLEGEDEDNNPAGEASDDTVKVKAVDEGTLDINASAKNTVLLKSDRSLAEFTIKPSKSGEDDVVLKKLSFKLTQGDVNEAVAFGTAENPTLKVIVDGDDISKEATAYDGTYLTFTPDVPVPAEGIVVKVSLKSEVAISDTDDGARILTVTDINTDDHKLTRKFQKYYLPAILKITQEKKGDITKYNIDVEKDESSITVSALEFLVEDTGKACTDGTDCKVLSIVADELSNTDNSGQAVNGEAAKSVKFIRYTISGINTPVLISRSVYEDYFKVNGGDYLMVFSNK